MIHPENIRPGMWLVCVEQIHSIPEPMMDYENTLAGLHDRRLFESLAGFPLLVLAMHFPFIITRSYSLPPHYMGMGDRYDKSKTQPLDLRRFRFDRIGLRYAKRLMPRIEDEVLEEAKKILGSRKYREAVERTYR